MLLGLNTLRKMGIFTEPPGVTTETTEIYPEPQNLTSYDKKLVESVANSQGAAGPTKQTQHNIPAEDTMTYTEQGYVSPDNNESRVFFRITKARIV